MVFALLAFITVVAGAATDPTIDDDPNGRQGWYSAPNYRGTLDILWPCLLTVSLCCWNAIHPDIPHPKSTRYQRFIDRTACFIVGIVGPETFVWFAYRERFWARCEQEERVALFGKGNWSVTHGFFAGMGGLAVDLTSESTDEISGCCTGYVYEESLFQLLDEGRLNMDTWITKQDILDKGKADSLIKGFTILQLVWLVVQSSARLAQKLPLTTLELSTLAYVPCAMLIYYLWWDKPYEVNIPTQLILVPKDTSAHHNDTEVPISDGGSHSLIPTPADGRPNSLRSQIRSIEIATGSPERRASSSGTDLHHDEDSQPMLRIEAYQTYGMVKKAMALPDDYFESNGHLIVTSAVFLFMGAIHMSAWNFDFATTAEQMAWRISSTIVTFCMPLAWLNAHIADWIYRHYTSQSERTEKSVYAYRFAVSNGAVVVYAIARLYLIVEVFVALRASPKRVYQTPEWTDFLPHFG